jgi:hypothetical protein
VVGPRHQKRPLPLASRACVAFVLAAAVVLAAALLEFASNAEAQGVDCGRLQAQIAAIDQADARTNPYAGAAQKQRDEINRTRAYAQSVGCDRQQFLFFGNAPPPQCPQLIARIQQMQANLNQLQANAHASNNPQRQDLVLRYNAYCRAEQPQQQKGFLEQLFGGPSQQTPTEAAPDQPLPTEDEQKPKGGSEVLCVRSCDGGFFPMSSARRGGENLADLCRALCPNADAVVYSRVPGQAIQTAVSFDGSPYSDLPAALKYQKTFDPACTCRPPNQSWAEALAGAERMVGHERKGDIIVTPEKSAEMSRPKLDTAQRAKAPKANDAKPAPDKAQDKVQDDIESRDAVSAAQVPTASKDSAGIATGEIKTGTAYPEGQGQTVEVTGPDGVKRRVRIVGPAL